MPTATTTGEVTLESFEESARGLVGIIVDAHQGSERDRLSVMGRASDQLVRVITRARTKFGEAAVGPDSGLRACVEEVKIAVGSVHYSKPKNLKYALGDTAPTEY